MRVQVIVRLKNGVLDPQGKAIENALQSLEYNNVSNVRQGKIIELNINDDDKDAVIKQAHAMAEKMLANTVMEDFSIHIVE